MRSAFHNAAFGSSLQTAAGEPAWSPDGTQLAYSATSESGHLGDVYVASVDGSSRVNLTAGGPRAAYGEPAWSRDGRRIAYVGALRSGYQDALFSYFVAKVDGSAVTQVGTSPTVGTPSFSPDDRYLALDGFESVWVARTDGSGQREVAAAAGTPIFSPHVDRLAFLQATGANGLDLFTARPDGSARKRLTKARGWDIPLAWSRGGSYLLFDTDREAPTRPPAVYPMGDGTRQHRIGYGREADFSPGAARVVFAGQRGSLWVARLDGGGRRQLVSGVVHDPRWSPDGRWIAYTLTAGDSRIELVRPDGSDRHVFVP